MKKIIIAILSFCIGSTLLCILATFQKISVGAPLVLKGYIVPFFFGGTAGVLLGIGVLRLREARISLQKAYDELEERIEERTRELKTEIEDRERIEQELRYSEERFRCLSDAAFEGILFTKKGIILESNETLCTMLGFLPSELLGKAATDFVSIEERENVESKMLSGYEQPYETRCLKKDGSMLPIEVQAKMFSYKGQQVRVTAIRDISEREKAEKEIQTLRGILPICASCKKIRDDKGYWNQIESYIQDHSEAEFSHGICQECAKKLYPDLVDENGNF